MRSVIGEVLEAEREKRSCSNCEPTGGPAALLGKTPVLCYDYRRRHRSVQCLVNNSQM